MVGADPSAARPPSADSAYARLGQLLYVLGDWEVVPFDQRAADLCASLRQQRVRIGTMDLKIAPIALTNDALLVTANLRDFSLVAGLRCENWLQRTEQTDQS